MRRIAAGFLALVMLSGIARAAEPGVTLGILEESPALYAKSPAFFKIRLAFVRRADGWAAVCHKDFCPPESAAGAATWSVGFSGKYLGNLPPPHAAQSEWVLDAKGVPTVGKPSAEFGSFLDSTVHRPLIVSSRQQFDDPEGWQKGKRPAKVIAALRSEFRKKFPEVGNCLKAGDEEAQPWKYSDANIQVPKFYRSRNAWALAALQLSPYRCEGPEDDAFAQQWFAISPEGAIKFLDEGVWLVDAGDYDADGRSELIFAIDRYNEGGYILYYSDFAKHATANFHYH